MKLLYGVEGYLIDQKLNSLIKDKKDQTVFYDETSPLENIIAEVATISLFSEKKTIIVRNHPVLTKKLLSEEFVEEWKEDDDVEVIFVLEVERIDSSNPLIQLIKRSGEIIKFEKINANNLYATIKDIVANKGGRIENRAAIKLGGILPNNLRIVTNEIDKLLLESKEITDQMIETSVGDYLNENTFKLINAIINQDNKEIIEGYQEALENGNPPLDIVGQIASTLNQVLIVSSSKKNGLSSDEIAKANNIHIFRVKKFSDFLINIEDQKLEKIVLLLAELDKNIKTGMIDETKGLDHFILNLMK